MAAKRFEKQKDLDRESRAVALWAQGIPPENIKKLGRHDVDFLVLSHGSNTTAYVEVKGRYRSVADAYPLPVAARKLVKLYDTLTSDPNVSKAFIIWACDDGIIAGDMDEIVGKAMAGGRKRREGSANDWEVMVKYNRQQALRETMY